MTPERIEAAALRAAHRINGRWTTDEVDIAEFAERDSAIIIEELTRHFAGDGEVIAAASELSQLMNLRQQLASIRAALGPHHNPALSLADNVAAVVSSLEGVLAEVREWQAKGRSGFCMPVLRGDVLAALEKLA